MKTEEHGSELTEQIIRLGIEVHRPRPVYCHCLCRELHHANPEFKREAPLAVVYEDVRLNAGYFADIIVEQTVLLELKSAGHILPVHEAQTRTYLRLSGCSVALLMNFNTVLLKDGLRRFIP